MDLPLMKNIRKIAILRANGLGDFIVALPAITAVKAAYPKAELVLLGKPWHADFLRGSRTPIDRVVVVPVCKNIREEPGIWPDADELQQFFAAMRDEGFDLATHFQGRGIASNAFINQLGARITVGHTCPEAAPIDKGIPYYYYQNETLRYLEAVASVGAPPVKLEPEVRLLETDWEEARQVLSSFAVRKPYVVLHSGAQDIRRRWPAEKFTALGDVMARKGYTVLFTGNEEENTAIADILSGMQMRQEAHACTQLSLGGLGAVLAGSVLVISNDTGPLHLARAVGAKTVGLFWAPNLINWGPVMLRNHRPVISWTMECPQCGTVPNSPHPFEPKMPDCDHRFSFINDITVTEVTVRAEELLPPTSTVSSNNHYSSNTTDHASTP